VSLDRIQNLPAPVKAGLVLASGGGILAAAYAFLGVKGMVLILVGIAVVAALLLAYRWLVKAMDKRKANPFMEGLTQNSAAAPQGISEPAKRARLDDLRKNFEGGVEKFRAAGKNLYSVPWYLLVGEPGSGKTEAIRHCNVGFPPGLQDQLQGAGGTLNMNWWFTNHAVILDTAGRLMFEEAPPGQTTEWQEFLKLLRKSRPNCPVNGMLLVIPADSLIRDTADQIEKKAGKIAQQLDQIQRALGVRFPVFVVVTKCDLINGFREFFDNLEDPQLQHQILGWSNPADLDQPFKPELVEEHLSQVRDRMVRRRTLMLQDPVHTENASGRRIEQVDALYAFPDSVAQIAPRMRRYLEMIFVAGEWSTKPLFLRGIYFTSSMREGSALDAELAEALGVSIESLPEGRVWERDRAYFLRDLFMQKVFKERGLVTHAGNVARTQRRRRAVVLGAGLGTVVLLIGLTILGGLGFRRAVGTQLDFWRGAADQLATSRDSVRLVRPAMAGSATYQYHGKDPLAHAQDSQRVAAFISRAGSLSQEPINVPGIFAVVASFSRDLGAQREDAARAILQTGAIQPLVEAAVARLKNETPADWKPTTTGALAQLIRLDTLSRKAGRPTGASAVSVEPLVRYVVTEGTQFDQTETANLQHTADALFPSAQWESLGTDAATRDVREAIAAAVPKFVEHWSSAAAGTSGRMGALQDLSRSMAAFEKAETVLLQIDDAYAGGAPEPATTGEYNAIAAKWNETYKELTSASAAVGKAVDALGALGADLDKPAADLCDGALTDLLSTAKAEYDLLRDQARIGPADPKAAAPAPSPTLDALDKGYAALDDAARKLAASLKTELARLQPVYIDRVKSTDLRLFSLRGGMYAQSEARLKAAAPAGVPDFGDLDKALSGARADSDKAVSSINSLLAPAAAVPRCKDAADLSKFMISLAQRRLTTDWVNRVLAATPESPADFQAKVVDLAGRHPEMEAPPRPTLAMTQMEGGHFKPVYNPALARMILADWSLVARAINPPKGTPPSAFDAESLRTNPKADTAARAYTRYATDYVNYWSRTVPDEEAAIVVKDWPEFVAKARSLKPADANGDVNKLLVEMNRALATVPEDLAGAGAKDARDRVNAQIALLDERYDRRCRGVRDSWSGLGDTQPAARDALLHLPRKQLEEEFLDLYSESPGKAVFFWNNFVLSALETLALGTETEGRKAISALTQDAAAFPVMLTTDRARVLTMDDVKRFRTMAQSFPSTSAQPAKPAERRRDQDSPYAEVDARLARISGVSLFKDDNERAWADKVRNVLSFLADAPTQKCDVVLLDDTEQDKPCPSGGAKASGPFPYLDVVIGEAQPLGPFSTRNLGKPNVSFPAPGDKVKIRFREAETADGKSGVELLAPWNAVALAQLPGAFVDDKAEPGRTLLKAPITFNDAAGQPVYYWIGVKFERTVPAREQWPTDKDWPARETRH
jgi:hypothetical protein